MMLWHMSALQDEKEERERERERERALEASSAHDELRSL
jgi:hypothetical protein